MNKVIKINERDNVAVALEPLFKGEQYLGVRLTEDIGRGHKFALCPIAAGENVVKYGWPIGHATQPIAEGSHVHEHNVATNLSGQLAYCFNPVERPVEHNEKPATVQVYPRFDGQVGVRNELWVVPLVGCVNAQARAIVRRFEQLHPGCPGVDGVHAFSHPYGCSQIGEDHLRTRTLLQKMVRHPNAGGVLVLGLGCENNRMADFIATLGNHDPARVRFLVAQEVEDEVAAGVALLEELYAVAAQDKRVPRDISCLRVGLKCGGSDGLSGLTANPLVGIVSDKLVAEGATTVLTEVPEMFGAEQLLMDRAKDQTTFNKIVALINGFKQYYADHNQPCYENPSPGNRAGGITTLEDKSLGCVQKSGSSAVCDVVDDFGSISQRGLNLLNGPGNDMVAVTNLACAGCHIVLFTTGRGTPFGGFVPTVKISTNSELAMRKRGWIDFDAGSVVQSGDFADAADALFKLVLDVANGRLTVNERQDSRDIALFKTGVTL